MEHTEPDEAEEAQYPRYLYKASLMGSPWSFQLAPDALIWSFGLRAGRTPYRDIRRIRLGFRPVTMQHYRFLAEIWPARGPRVPIASSSWKSLVEQERQDDAYTDFVTELHRRVAQAGGNPRLDAGALSFLYWPGLVVLSVISLALIGLIVSTLRQGDTFATLFLLGFFVLLVWQLGVFFKRNRPRRYTLERIPRDVLP